MASFIDMKGSLRKLGYISLYLERYLVTLHLSLNAPALNTTADILSCDIPSEVESTSALATLFSA
jgi:hypothetical protein